jgi:predicted metal-binding transcription factor (methanogenesis marker protein 9)
MDDLNLTHDGGDDFDAAAALLDRWVKKPDAEKPSAKPEDEDDDDSTPETGADDDGKEQEEADEGEQSEEDPQESDGDEDGEEEKGEKPAERKFADDDTYFKITVDGAEHEVSAKELKRLWGQEASLTRKSQETAQQNKIATERRTQYETALNSMYQKAVERAKPYAQIDFALAAKNLSSEDYAALKKDAQAAFADVQFFEQELKDHGTKVSKEAQEAHAKAAEEAVKALTSEDSPHHVPGWNETVYNDLIDYGVKQGIPREQMLQSTSAPSFKILWMAQQFEKSQKVATQKTKKVVGKKPISAKGPKDTSSERPAAAMQRLKKSGSVEDAAMTLFERWASA